MYADDTTIYCIGESVDSVTNTLNNALKLGIRRLEFKEQPGSSPQKVGTMMLLRGSFTHTVQSHHKMGDSRTTIRRNHASMINSHELNIFLK